MLFKQHNQDYINHNRKNLGIKSKALVASRKDATLYYLSQDAFPYGLSLLIFIS